MADNRRKFFSSVLSIDAWHDPVKIDDKTAGVYVEVSFKEGRIGGDAAELPFTFKLTLRRAVLIIRLEAPLAYDRASVARSIPEMQVELSKIQTARELALSSLVGGAKLSPASLAIALGAEGKSEQEVTQSEQMRIVQTLPETLVTPFPEGEFAYTWTLDPTFRDSLRGQPWDPVKNPRLRVGYGGNRPSIDSAITVELRCALEDLEIFDLETKETTPMGLLKEFAFNKINLAAAQQHIKLLLTDADLVPPKLDNRFNDILLASVLAIEN